ncbi:MAG: hypothetical protein J6Y80_05445 [Victivallales bacterium]|nr:hypothetical protein [Victivallales bacterium]
MGEQKDARGKRERHLLCPRHLADHAVVADESGLSQSAGSFARLRLAQKGTAKRICHSLATEMPVNVANNGKKAEIEGG